MPFRIIRDDISRVAADAIVCSASPDPRVGGGGEAAIHAAAGPGLLRARDRFGRLQPGAAVATKAYGLHAKFVIHTVGPVWKDGKSGEVETLHNCYRNAICTAISMGCKSAAFPLISSGAFGFSKSEALRAALWEFQCFAEEDIELILVVYDRESFALSEGRVREVAAYIDDRYVEAHPSVRNRGETQQLEEARRRSAPQGGWEEFSDASPGAGTTADASSEGSAGQGDWFDDFFTSVAAPESDDDFPSLKTAPKMSVAPAPSAAPKGKEIRKPTAKKSPFGIFPRRTGSPKRDLEARMRELDAGFSETLLQLIDASGCTDAEIYKRANISRKLFSKIRSSPDYRPSKPTVLAFCVALHMKPAAARELLSRAGYALSHSSRFDVIVEYFLESGNYDIIEINETLFYFDQPLLGSA